MQTSTTSVVCAPEGITSNTRVVAHTQALQLGTWVACLGIGMAMVHSGNPLLQALACLPLGMSLTDCCWLAHDYIHGRGRWCQAMRNFGGWGGGAWATVSKLSG